MIETGSPSVTVVAELRVTTGARFAPGGDKVIVTVSVALALPSLTSTWNVSVFVAVTLSTVNCALALVAFAMVTVSPTVWVQA